LAGSAARLALSKHSATIRTLILGLRLLMDARVTAKDNGAPRERK
jgi:hypothetical protein